MIYHTFCPTIILVILSQFLDSLSQAKKNVTIIGWSTLMMWYIHIPPCCKTYRGLSTNFVLRFLYNFFQFKFHKWNNYINYVWLIYVPALCNSKQILWRCAIIIHIYISNLMINDKSLFMTFGMILSVYLCCYATNLCSVPFCMCLL